MNKTPVTALLTGLAIALLLAVPAQAQWSAEPGATVRNAFGPQAGNQANQCRGACGSGCPDSCTRTVTWECQDAARLSRIETYDCGTAQGCRVHDDCLDTCLQSSADSGNCQRECDAQVVQRYGIESSGSWLMGRGPYDGRINFQYTRAAPDALEASWRCPDGATRQCGGSPGCATADGTRVEPVFDAYPAAGPDAMRISAFRAGPACGDGVCEQSADIRVTGGDTCPGGSCTRFGMEFDYRNADPSAPLECSTSTRGGDSDFVGDLLKQGADAMTARGAGAEANTTANAGGQSQDGMAQLMGLFGQVLASADAPEDVQVSMAPLDENGNPIESQRVGSTSRDGEPPIPTRVELPAASGHLFVPMYQLADGSVAGQGKERTIRCTHKGAPVLETTFRLSSG
jgi:hypothetical protein